MVTSRQEQTLAARVETIAASMDGVFQESEQICLSVGNSLGEALDSFGKLAGIFESLPASFDGPEFSAAVQHLSALAGRVVAIGEGLSGEQAALRRLTDRSRGMTGFIESLRNNISTISALTIYAKIEVKSIDAGGDDLNGFILDLTGLAGGARTMIDEHWSEHGKLIGLLQSSCAAQAEFERTHQTKLLALGRELRDSLAAISARRQTISESSGDISRRSRQIGQAIGSAVMALQVGDSTRQRVEHVHATLGEVRASPESAAEQDMLAADVACRLQSVQTSRALEEFEGEMEGIRASLTQLSQQARSMVEFGGKLYGGSHGNDESFIQTLKTRLGVAGALLREVRVARLSVDSVMQAATDTLKGLQQRLKKVSGVVIDMTLIGMNGILKSSRAGTQGKGLSVIAQELRGYANQVIESAELLKTALQEVIVSAGEFEASRSSQGDDGMAELDREMEEALNGIERSGAELSDALKTLSEEGARASHTLDHSAEELGRNDTMRDVLDHVAAELDQIAAEIEQGGSDRLGAVRTAALWKRYTMASERAIHKDIAGQRGLLAA